MKNYDFLLNLNRCVGCGACVLACTIENSDRQNVNWREIYTFNETRHPGLPVFHLSLACNHCENPACVSNCPAAALEKDKETGIVSVDAEKCLGCKYCTWACPFDAPRYDKKKGVIEKCDGCQKRRLNNEAPACVCACPTNALRLVEKTSKEIKTIRGFTPSQLKPSIQFIPLRENPRSPLPMSPPFSTEINQLFVSSIPRPPKKISLKSEWTLLLFTFIAFILVAWFTAMVFLSPPNVPGPPSLFAVSPFWFLATGVVAMALSTIHLGKKSRAYRAIFNLKTSWLSREIFLFSLFLGLAGIFYIQHPPLIPGWVVVLVGFFSLFAIDRIYQLALQVGPLHFHSAHTFLNALYLTSLLTREIFLFTLFGTIKLALYLYRKYLIHKQKQKVRLWLTFGRILSGFIVPAGVIIAGKGWSDFSTFFSLYGIVISSVVIGELVDRVEYYSGMEVMTPRKQMVLDLESLLNGEPFFKGTAKNLPADEKIQKGETHGPGNQ